MRVRRVLLALFGGSAASAAALAGAMSVLNAQYDASAVPLTFAVWFILTFAMNTLIASTFGLTWHALASRRGWRGLTAYLAPGALLGLAIPFCLFTLPALLSGHGFEFDPVTYITVVTAIIGIVLGGLTALFAWLIRRPDRSP